MKISIVIPVYNENSRLPSIIEQLLNKEYDEVIVIDDGSSDPIKIQSDYNKIRLIRNNINQGYLDSVKRGIAIAKGEIVVTMDGDGEHRVEDIEKLLQPIIDNKCDIVFGKRPIIARFSEKLLLNIAKMFASEKVKDAGTGFRAIRSSFAKQLKFNGMCTCGTLLLEAHSLGMRICEVEVDLPAINKPRRIAWEHVLQLFYVIVLSIRVFSYNIYKKVRRGVNEKFISK